MAEVPDFKGKTLTAAKLVRGQPQISNLLLRRERSDASTSATFRLDNFPPVCGA
jgi:hypothetical protein